MIKFENSLLKKYLESEGYIDRFRKNIDVRYIDNIFQNGELNAISSAFLWASTEEGVDYWERINNEWVKYYKKHKKRR